MTTHVSSVPRAVWPATKRPFTVGGQSLPAPALGRHRDHTTSGEDFDNEPIDK
jgi:hypothetical protein